MREIEMARRHMRPPRASVRKKATAGMMTTSREFKNSTFCQTMGIDATPCDAAVAAKGAQFGAAGAARTR